MKGPFSCIAALAIAVVYTACAASQPWDRVSLTVTNEPVFLRYVPEGVGFDVTAMLVNNSSTPLIIGGSCVPDVQRNLEGSWQTVWFPICIGSAAQRPVAPGDSARVEAHVFGYTIAREPKLDPRMKAGIYRLRIGLTFSQTANITSSDLRAFPSIPFNVVDSSRIE
jgi:hypothetical protein